MGRRTKRMTVKQLVWSAVTVLGILAAANFAFVYYNIGKHEKFASVTDIAGATRLLSQKIVLEASKGVRGDLSAHNRIDDLISLHDYYLTILHKGGDNLKGDNSVYIPAPNAEVSAIVSKSYDNWSNYKNKSIEFTNLLEKGTAQEGLLPLLSELELLAEIQLAANKSIVDLYIKSFNEDITRFKQGFIFFQLLIMLSFILIIAGLQNQVLATFYSVINTCEELAAGATVVDVKTDGRPDMQRLSNAFNKIVRRNQAATNFAEAIGQADFSVELKTDGGDRLSEALLGMRDKLKEATERTTQQRWAAEGLSEFEVLMRQTYDSTEKLGDAVLSKLVRHLNASQAALFVLNDEEGTNKQYLEMSSCYAMNRKKHINKRIELGEGLAGQCVQELDTFYFTDIPEGYTAIRSGLGEAKPNTLLVAPLVYNDEVHGVLEIASFKPISEHERTFIAKLTENIASTLGRQMYAGRIEHLLGDARMNTEQMQAQEEEMRQHMEEMMATQEEMERKEREYQQMIAQLEKALAERQVVAPEKELSMN